jgi:bifunctional non-homologous end joining protein LigD
MKSVARLPSSFRKEAAALKRPSSTTSSTCPTWTVTTCKPFHWNTGRLCSKPASRRQSVWRLVEYFVEDGEAIYQAAVAHGMEGVVAKRRDSAYEAGRRSKKWLKAKVTRSDEFVVCGYTEGTGTRADTFGALVLGMRQQDGSLVYAGEVGTGFDSRTLRALRGRLDALKSEVPPLLEPASRRKSRWSWLRQSGPITWVRPELMAEVKYAERTDDGELRAPVFLRVREDR